MRFTWRRSGGRCCLVAIFGVTSFITPSLVWRVSSLFCSNFLEYLILFIYSIIFTKVIQLNPFAPNAMSIWLIYFSLSECTGLKPEQKLLNLESRNFFLCPKPNCRINLSLKNKAKSTEKLPLILAKFMDLLIQIVINLSFWPKCHP